MFRVVFNAFGFNKSIALYFGIHSHKGLKNTAILLIERGANLNTITPDYGYTPLQLSLMIGRIFKII